MAFADDMRNVATMLLRELGSSCVLQRVTPGEYNPLTGETLDVVDDFSTYSGPVSLYNETFGLYGINTNLDAFDTNKVIIPWFGYEVDATWLYNGQNITRIDTVATQNKSIIFTITVGEK